MTKRRAAKRKGSAPKKAALILEKSEVDTLAELLGTMGGESDRGCLLVGLSEIEIRLGELLLYVLCKYDAISNAKWLLDPKAGNRPLGSLAVRTRVARCLGLINDDLEKVIDALRGIRNTHAHGTSKLRLTASDIAPIMDAWAEYERKAIEERAAVTTEPRKRLAIRKLVLTFGLVSVLLERCLTNAKDYDDTLKHLFKVAGKVIPKSEDKRNQPGIR